MSNLELSIMHAVIVETDARFSLAELGRTCGVDAQLIESLVQEGALNPVGESPAQWRFQGSELRRARIAARLVRDLDLNAAGAALVLDLLAQVEALHSQLQRLHSRPPVPVVTGRGAPGS